MAYGKIKADTLTWDDAGTDTDITISTIPTAADLAAKLGTADIGVTVQAYDANLPAGNTILVDGDVGSVVQAYDATILNDADIGVTVQGYDATILNDADIGVSVQAYDADTTKNDVANTFTAEQTFNAGLSVDGPYKQAAEAVTNLDIDLSTGNYFTKTINANSTFTFSNPPTSGTVGSFTLEVTHTSGTITWPTEVKWPGDTAPSLTDGTTHLFIFITDDNGARYRGASLVDYVN